MTVQAFNDLLVDPPTAEAVWDLYREAFEPLEHLAANRHVMTLAEFTMVVGNTDIAKYVTRDQAGAVTGIGCVTNELGAVPLISPAYFRHNWPHEYEQGRIWYVPFMATNRAPGAFRELLLACSAPARESGGLVFMDFCDHNVEAGVPVAAFKILRRADARVHAREVDAQRFHLFAFDSADDLVESGGHES